MLSEGTLCVQDYQRGAQRPIRNFSIAPMPDHPGRWQGQFELTEPKEAAVLLQWCENRRRLRMSGMERATIRWVDFSRGVTYEFTAPSLSYDGLGFTFTNATRNR